RNGLEAERGAELIDGVVDLPEGGFDGAVGGDVRRRCESGSEGGEGPEQASAELDQDDAELEAAWGEAVASGSADPLDEAVSPELAEVVAQLAESVVRLGEAVSIEQPCEDVAGGRVGREAAGVE